MTIGGLASYDEIPYPLKAWREMQARRVESMAALYGLDPPPLATARVLELGCASGGHLLPQAVAFPEAEFLGVDLSESQIATGRKLAGALGAENVELRVADLRTIDESWGRFDYILCHGVHSWVPPDAQDRILAVCRDNMTEAGVAAVSYNVHPYWRVRQLVREAMQFHLAGQSPSSSLEALSEARRIVDLLARHAGADPLLAQLFQREAQRARQQPDPYAFHDLLEEHNHPVYFHEIVASAAEHGLAHVADLESGTVEIDDFPGALRPLMRGQTPERREQYLDFVFQRAFRRSLLCHADRSRSATPVPERLRDQSLLLMEPPDQPLRDPGPTSPMELRVRGRVLRVQAPLEKATLSVLVEARPEPLAAEEVHRRAVDRVPAAVRGTLPDEAMAFATFLRAVASHVRRGLVETFVHAPTITAAIGERPVASAYARVQAAEGIGSVTTLLHKGAQLDGVFLLLLRHLDGEHDRSALASVLLEGARRGELDQSEQIRELPQQKLLVMVDTVLDGVREMGLLTA